MAPRKILNLANKTRDAIYAHYENQESLNDYEPLPWIRASELGHKCERYIWMKRNMCFYPSFDGRMLRLFDTGNVEESRVIADLGNAGIRIVESQYEVVGLDGRLKGHIDGVALGVIEDPETPHLFECKTHSLKSFEKLVAEGVEKSKPQHYAQMQVYMGLIDPPLDRGLYVAVNKNNDEIYCEIIKKDEKAVAALLAKAERILNSEELPAKVSESFEFPPCSWCDFKDYCHQTWPNTERAARLPNVNERTAPNGVFKPSLVPFTPLEGDINSVVYLTLDGKRLLQSQGKFEEVKA